MTQKLTFLALALCLSVPTFARPPHGPDHTPPHADDRERRPLSPALAEELREQEEDILAFITAKDPEAANH